MSAARLSAAEYRAAYDSVFGKSFAAKRQSAHTPSHFWNDFYKRNKRSFFKDRHWTTREFPQLLHAQRILEVGCGVGNFIFPLLALPEVLCKKAYVCDYAPVAVDFVLADKRFDANRMHAFVCDAAKDDVCSAGAIEEHSVDVAVFLFVLSAIPADRWRACIRSTARSLRLQTGVVVMRDYAADDEAQCRFEKTQKAASDSRAFLRGDGTMAVFLTAAQVAALFEECGFCVEACEVVEKPLVNRKKDLQATRRFVQGIFRYCGPSAPNSCNA